MAFACRWGGCNCSYLVSSIYQNWLEGNIDKAREAQQKLRSIRNASAMASTPAVFKKAMELLGEPVGPPRFPVEQVEKEVTEKIHTIIKQYK